MSNTKLKVVSTTNTPTEADELTARLEAQLQEITHKKRLADNRAVFIEKKNSLQEFKKLIDSEINSGNFETSKFKLTFSSSQGSYRDEEKFTISNSELILFFIGALTLQIEGKVKSIEADLIG